MSSAKTAAMKIAILDYITLELDELHATPTAYRVMDPIITIVQAEKN